MTELGKPRPLRDVVHDLGVSVGAFAAAVKTSDRSVQRWYRHIHPITGEARTRVYAWLLEQGVEPHTVVEIGRKPVSRITPATPAPKARKTAAVRNPPATPRQEETPLETTTREYLEPEELNSFGLAADPFDDPEDPEQIFLPTRTVNLERQLYAAIQRRQIVALVGPAGAGKSSILRRLYGRCQRENRVRLIAAASIDRERIDHAALSSAILRDLLGKDTSGLTMEARSELLRTTLADQVAAGLYPVLLIDEAHLLRTKALLAVKQLWDSHTLYRQLAVLLIGQLPLQARLKQDPAVRELTGRTRVIEIQRMADDTADYLRWRFSRVGADADKVFDEKAYKALAIRGEHALWINNLAVLAMRYASENGYRRVTDVHVGQI